METQPLLNHIVQLLGLQWFKVDLNRNVLLHKILKEALFSLALQSKESSCFLSKFVEIAADGLLLIKEVGFDKFFEGLPIGDVYLYGHKILHGDVVMFRHINSNHQVIVLQTIFDGHCKSQLPSILHQLSIKFRLFDTQSIFMKQGGKDNSAPKITMQTNIQLLIIIYIMASQEITHHPAEPKTNHIQSNSSELIMRNSPLLLRIHADDQDKKTICIFWTVLFVIAMLIVIISVFALPKIFIKNSNLASSAGTSVSTCQNPSGASGSIVTCQQSQNQLYYGEIVKGWGPANQFGFLYLEVRPSDISQTITIKQDIMMYFYDLRIRVDSGVTNFHRVGTPQQLNASLNFVSSKEYSLYGQDKKTIVGYQYLLAILTRFDDNPFLQIIQFTQSLNLPNSTKVNLQSYAVNPKFTYYTIILRYFFFAFSIMGCVLYFIRFMKIPKEKTIIEQKMIGVASVLLVMFNDPFYIITVLKPNGASAFFSLLFIVNMIAFLLLLWLVFADRICFEDGQIETSQLTKKKIAYVLLVWVLLIICLMIFTMQQIDHAPLVPSSFSKRYMAAQVIIGLVVFAGIIYIAYRFIKSCIAEGRTWRSYLFMVFSSIFIFAVFIIIVTNSLILYNYSGPAILIIFTLINIYIYYLQYMYTITRDQVEKLDNPVPEVVENNYDALTVGTIELVDINLDDDDEEGVQHKPKEKERREERREDFEMKSDKNEFESEDFQ